MAQIKNSVKFYGRYKVFKKNPRNIEFGFLLFGALISLCGLLCVDLGVNGFINAGAICAGAVFWAIVFILHILMRWRLKDADPLILPSAALLNIIGVIVIYRIDLVNNNSRGFRQLIWSVIALLAAAVIVMFLKNHRKLQNYTYIFMVLSFIMLIMPMIPGLGSSQGTNATLWVSFFGITFQPSEFVKITLAVFFASYLIAKADSLTKVNKKFLGFRFPRLRDSAPFLLLWGVSMAVLVIQKDLGTALLYFGLFLLMVYYATGLASWVVMGLLAFGGGCLFAYKYIPVVSNRVASWLNTFDNELYDKVSGSAQQAQGLFGLAHGGLFGTGLGRGWPAQTPLSWSDYIFTSIGEEIGFFGIMAVMFLYLIIIARALKVGVLGIDDFGKMLSVGLAFIIALQVFIVIAGITRIIPVTGLPLPFLASGGTSIVSSWIIIALILVITNSAKLQNKNHITLQSNL